MSIYTILSNEIETFRNYAGQYDLKDRQFFVEQFMGRVGDRYVPKTDSNQIIRDWADEHFRVGLDMTCPMGDLMLMHILSELPIASLRAELQACADDAMEDILKEQEEAHGEVNGHESE